MSQVPKPDPAVIAAVKANATRRNAHYQAGHAVAAVARGGHVLEVCLGTADWSTFDTSGDTNAYTHHVTEWRHRAFVTFAGPCAEAMWTRHGERDGESKEPMTMDPDFWEVLDDLRLINMDFDNDDYQSQVALLEKEAAQIGFSPNDRESYWVDELEALWPAICEVAAMLIDGEQVRHEDIRAAVDRCANLG
jgi:hypothetical protein